MLFSWLSSQRRGGLSATRSLFSLSDCRQKVLFHVQTHGRCVNELDGEPLHAWQCKYLTSCERCEQPGRSIQLNLWRFCHPLCVMNSSCHPALYADEFFAFSQSTSSHLECGLFMHFVWEIIADLSHTKPTHSFFISLSSFLFSSPRICKHY